MVLYLSIMFGWLILSIVGNVIYASNTGVFSITSAIVVSIIVFVSLFTIDAIVALIVHACPHQNFNPEKGIFKVKKHEKRILERLGVKKIKDIIPEMGKLINFRKDKIESTDSKYLYRFLEETCYAELMHIISIIACLIVPILCPFKYFLTISLGMTIINILLQIPPIMVQRYNRPKLLTLYKYNKRKEERAASIETSSEEQ